ncbi:nuclear factor 7, brain-like [Chanos chanos]|uniref:Nuclear factor 7, brain-like n=1 Tax=Chanos chanos TaxID=29144 RepID=A0A6J2WAI4_CHACN|nr:nuclear factor 7, brain-like [Chanos chanos]
MASSLLMHIQCSVCLSDYTDPVSLPCDHSYCRQCICGHVRATTRPDGKAECPECRTLFSPKDIRANRLLRNMADAIRDHMADLKLGDTAEDSSQNKLKTKVTSREHTGWMLCPLHEENLKLFCETEQKLICLICRDDPTHQGHKFVPVKEAANARKGEVKGVLGFLSKENVELDKMIQQQVSEISKTEERSECLSNQISAQFEEMHEFLRKREEDVKKMLEKEKTEAVESMRKNISLVEEKLSCGIEKQVILLSALDQQPDDSFLQWWIESGKTVTEEVKRSDDENSAKEANEVSPKRLYKSGVRDLHVAPDSLFLGPYETHLQFFVWKEMLRSIKPVPLHHSIEENDDPYLRVSPGGHSVFRKSKKGIFATKKDYVPVAHTKTFLKTGQHYWEVQVGDKLEWSVGVCAKELDNEIDTLLICSYEMGYVVGRYDYDDEEDIDVILVEVKPRKIGVYMDCERNEVSFYNADNMTLIDKTKCHFTSPHALCLSPGSYLEGKNIDPLSMCWY